MAIQSGIMQTVQVDIGQLSYEILKMAIADFHYKNIFDLVVVFTHFKLMLESWSKKAELLILFWVD